MADTSKQNIPTAMFSATHSQKSGAKSDRLIDPKFSQTLPVESALLASQRQNAPTSRKIDLWIPE